MEWIEIRAAPNFEVYCNVDSEMVSYEIWIPVTKR